MAAEDVRVVSDAIVAFNRSGVEAALEYLDPEVEWIGPPEWLEEHIYHGHDGVGEVASIWTENFDDYRLDLERTIHCGDHVVALLHQRARIKGSGDPIEQAVGYDWELRDGKAIRVQTYFSWEAALEAAGLTPPE